MSENTPARPTVPSDDVEAHLHRGSWSADGAGSEDGDVEAHVFRSSNATGTGEGDDEGTLRP